MVGCIIFKCQKHSERLDRHIMGAQEVKMAQGKGEREEMEG